MSGTETLLGALQDTMQPTASCCKKVAPCEVWQSGSISALICWQCTGIAWTGQDSTAMSQFNAKQSYCHCLAFISN
jgi:hypothetical protein